jgi:hypothetical protein
VRPALAATLLAAVLAASALDLALGALWVAAVVALAVARRRVHAAAGLVLVGCAALLAAGPRVEPLREWLAAPPPVSYEAGALPWAGGSAAAPAEVDAREAARARVAALAREELALTGAELERRARAMVALARDAPRARGRAPAEAEAVEDAARRLARTLAAPEFRDLEARRGRVGEFLAAIEGRLARAGDEAEVAAVVRATEPATMASVSLRAVREDLARTGSAAAALVRALGGREPTVTGSATVGYDEGRGALLREVRYSLAVDPPVALRRLDAQVLRSTGPSTAPVEVEYARDGAPPRGTGGAPWIELEPGVRRLELTVRWTEPARVTPVRPPLRLLAFRRLEIGATPAPAGVLLAVTVPLEGRDLEAPLVLALPPARVERLLVPARALHWVSQPGSHAREEDRDIWTPAPGVAPGALVAELVPHGVLFRNAVFAGIRRYVYRASVVTVVGTIGLAALALVLGRRPGAARAESPARRG